MQLVFVFFLCEIFNKLTQKPLKKSNSEVGTEKFLQGPSRPALQLCLCLLSTPNKDRIKSVQKNFLIYFLQDLNWEVSFLVYFYYFLT